MLQTIFSCLANRRQIVQNFVYVILLISVPNIVRLGTLWLFYSFSFHSTQVILNVFFKLLTLKNWHPISTLIKLLMAIPINVIIKPLVSLSIEAVVTLTGFRKNYILINFPLLRLCLQLSFICKVINC